MYTYIALSLFLLTNLTQYMNGAAQGKQAAYVTNPAQQKAFYAAENFDAMTKIGASAGAAAQAVQTTASQCTLDGSISKDIPGIGKIQLPVCKCPLPEVVCCNEQGCIFGIYCSNTTVKACPPCPTQLAQIQKINELLAKHNAQAFCCPSEHHMYGPGSNTTLRIIKYPSHSDTEWRKQEYLNYSLRFQESDSVRKRLIKMTCQEHALK